MTVVTTRKGAKHIKNGGKSESPRPRAVRVEPRHGPGDRGEPRPRADPGPGLRGVSPRGCPTPPPPAPPGFRDAHIRCTVDQFCCLICLNYFSMPQKVAGLEDSRCLTPHAVTVPVHICICICNALCILYIYFMCGLSRMFVTIPTSEYRIYRTQT